MFQLFAARTESRHTSWRVAEASKVSRRKGERIGGEYPQESGKDSSNTGIGLLFLASPVLDCALTVKDVNR